MIVQIFNIKELVEKSGIDMPPINGKPLRIRVRFEKNFNRTKRKQVNKLLKNMGYKQVGNTSSWILNPKILKVD